MSTNLKTTKNVMATRIRDLIAGTQKHPPSGPLTIDGQEYTAATLTQVLQSLGDALSAVDSANAAWKDALQNLATTNAKVEPIVSAYRTWIVATFGSAPATLADFGVTPRKVRTPATTAQTAEAIAKRNATRAARHTMGSKQKEAVKGTITTIVTPTPSPLPAPVPSPSAPVANPASTGTSAGTPSPHAS